MDLVREFLARSLAAEGAVVEAEGASLHVLLAEEAAARCGLPEEARIGFGSERGDGEAALDGRLGSSLVERMVAARLTGAPVAAVALPAELPRALPDDLPVLLNAVRTGAAERTRRPARFLAAEVRAVLRGEEIRSAPATVTVRLLDGARVTGFHLGAAYGAATHRLDDAERRRAGEAIRGWLRREGPRLLSGALDTLRRRAARDLERMANYYSSLDREMAAAVERARSDEERERRRAKRAALAEDLAARREQLRERMRARLSASLVAASLVETEVEIFEIAVRRRTREGRITVFSRAADRIFDGPRCAACGIETLRLYLCDERLHVLCEECGQAGRLDVQRCRACGREPRAAPSVAVEDPTASVLGLA